MEFKVGDEVDFLWTPAFEDNYPDFGKITHIYGEIIICRPYRSRIRVQCKPEEIKHSKKQ